MATGAAKTDTTLPTQGVDPYKFADPNIQGTLEKAVKTYGNYENVKQKIAKKEGRRATKAENAATEAAARAKSAGRTAKALQSISKLSSTQFPSEPIANAPGNKGAKAKLKRQMNAAGKPRKGKAAPAGSTEPVFQEPQPTAVQAVKASRAKAKQVRPRKQTSLSTHSL